MSCYTERMAVAKAHEEAVRARFIITGWCADPFGQAQLSEPCRNALRRWTDGNGRPSLVRWLPDLLVYTSTATPTIALVDAKGEISRTSNHAVELASIECDNVIAGHFNTPTYYVFSDFGVLAPDEVLEYGRPGPPPHNGSGTPYYLVPKARCHDFDAIFPPVTP